MTLQHADHWLYTKHKSNNVSHQKQTALVLAVNAGVIEEIPPNSNTSLSR